MGGEEGAKISWAQVHKVPKYRPGYDHMEKLFLNFICSKTKHEGKNNL